MKDINFLTSKGVDIKSSLELFGDIDTYNKTLGEFIFSAPEKLQKLENYKNNKDMGNYTIYVHSLMSDSKYFGFNELSVVASNHEVKSRMGDVLYIQQNFPSLQTAVGNAVAIANEYLNDTPPAGAATTTTAQAAPADAAAQPAQAGQQPAPSGGEVYDKATILVVDDSNIIRNFVKRIFSDRYNVGSAKNGQEAINIIYANKDNDFISAILLDLNMPGVDGFAVLEYMKENDLFSKIPVSIISGDSSRDTIDRAFTYTIVDMLGKPFTENDVKRILEKTILYKEML
ncbi:MAG: response regulator [Bacilli bacterium]|nr:response regulator [Bacilli bacterium]